MKLNRLSNSEIDAIESELGQSFPGLYRKFLVELGHGFTLAGNQIFCPKEINDRCQQMFDDLTQMFEAYFIFGCGGNGETIWVIHLSKELAASIPRETPLEEWSKETWLEYHDWIPRFLE